MDISKIIFFGSLFLIIYVYVGYPLILIFISFFYRNNTLRGEIEPVISIIIPAYNEEKNIVAKIKNCLELSYPKEKLEIIVASDGSTDETNNILKDFAKKGVITFLQFNLRLGKTFVQNEAVKISRGEILLFTDATTMLERDAIIIIVRNFYDKTVGCVSGKLLYRKNIKTTTEVGRHFFWEYEKIIKLLEGKISSLIGASGQVYAVRKDLYPFPDHYLSSDFAVPGKIVENGYRNIFEPQAIAFENVEAKTIEDEIKCRVRVIVGGLRSMFYFKSLLNPFKHFFYFFELFSHRILRWYILVFFVGMFVSNIFLLSKPPFKITFFAFLMFFLISIVGYVCEKKRIYIKFFMFPLYFFVVNICPFIATFYLLKGERKISWETIRY